MNDNRAYFNKAGLRMDEGRLHPVWAYVLMTLCVDAALLVGVYAIFAHGWVQLMGLGVVVLLVLAATLVYRTT